MRIIFSTSFFAILGFFLYSCGTEPGLSSQKDSVKIVPMVPVPKSKLSVDSVFKTAKTKAQRAGLFFDLSQLSLKEKDSVRALEYLEKSTALRPNSLSPLLALATLYAQKGQPKILALLHRILTLTKDARLRAQAYFLRGTYYAKKKNNPEAIAAFDKAIVADWTLISAYIAKGTLYFNAHNLPLAEKTFQLAYKVNHHHPVIYYWLGRIAETQKKIPDAAAFYQNALLLDKNATQAKERLHALLNAQK